MCGGIDFIFEYYACVCPCMCVGLTIITRVQWVQHNSFSRIGDVCVSVTPKKSKTRTTHWFVIVHYIKHTYSQWGEIKYTRINGRAQLKPTGKSQHIYTAVFAVVRVCACACRVYLLHKCWQLWCKLIIPEISGRKKPTNGQTKKRSDQCKNAKGLPKTRLGFGEN